jgi:uncharacterized protein
MADFKRYLTFELPQGQSAFLWGARKTGKSTYLRTHYPRAKYYDFLKTEVLMTYLQSPYLFREQVLAMSEAELARPIILDEVQKVPMLLNEVHWLIENTKAYFILCGSSARKLKRGAANLLGGRAWRFTFYPLVYPEIEKVDLLHVLNVGLIPSHYAKSKTDARRDLNAYVTDYLKEEIQDEGLTRNLPAFARFLDAVGYSHGQQINYTNIARDCGINASTVKAYFQILIDTLMGYEIFPFRKRIRREIISATPKFYLFDVGVVSMLSDRRVSELKGAAAGEAFEHYIFMELMAYRELNERHFKINYWRTKAGLEVDFILGEGRVAIEVKISQEVGKEQIRGLVAFSQEHKPEHAIVVSLDLLPRKIKVEDGTDILVLPWHTFLEQLWGEQLI